LSLDSLLVKDISDKALKANLPKTFRIDSRNQASASAQLTKEHLDHVLKEIGRSDCPETVTVVDLRQESHGFANGIPFSWYRCKNLINFGKTRSGAMFSETEALENLQHNIDNGLFPTISLHEIRVKLLGSIYSAEELILQEPVKIESEEQVCTSLGVNYARFPVVDHHNPDEIVADAFVRFVTTLFVPDSKDSEESSSNSPKKQQWLHFHCKGGRGRSTSFISMFSMLLHYLRIDNDLKVMTVEDFIGTQHTIGGSDLFKPPRCKNKQWKMAAFKNRERFLRYFYEYCVYFSTKNTETGASETTTTARQSWYDWIENKMQSKKSHNAAPEAMIDN